jgi:hypothetical protein
MKRKGKAMILEIEKEALDRPLRRTCLGEVNGFVVKHYEMNKQIKKPVQT